MTFHRWEHDALREQWECRPPHPAPLNPPADLCAGCGAIVTLEQAHRADARNPGRAELDLIHAILTGEQLPL